MHLSVGLSGRGLNLGVVALSAAIVSGCGASKLEEWQGRFGGQGKVAIVQTVKTDQGVTARLEVTSSSTQSGTQVLSETFWLSFRNEDGSLGIYSPKLGSIEIKLKRTDDAHCLSGSGEKSHVVLCFNEQEKESGRERIIRLAITELQDGAVREIALTQGKDPTDSLNPSAPLALDELMARAKFRNYAVSQEAERLFQARQNVSLARARLLPHLNFATLLGVATGGVGGLIESIGNLVPFLFPGNWFRFEQSKHLFSAEKDSFSSMRGNEMNGVEQLYYTIHRDQETLKYLDLHSEWMKKIQQNLKVEEQVGVLARGTADYYGVTIIKVDQDRALLAALIKGEVANLAQAVAISPVQTRGDLQPLKLPELSAVGPIRAADFFKQAQERSYEIHALKSLAAAAKYTKKEVIFGWFDPASEDGIGFGLRNSIRISKSRVREIEKRIDETLSVFEQRSVQIAQDHNALLTGYRLATEGFEATRKRVSWLIQRHLNGESELSDEDFVNELTKLQEETLSFASSKLSNVHGWLVIQARINRLLLQGYYDGLAAALPVDPELLKMYDPKNPQPVGELR